MGMTVGAHVIWTCKGTWMPGDARGHWSPLFDLYGRLRADGNRLNMPDAATLQYAMELMKDAPKTLGDDEFEIVADAFASQVYPRIGDGVVAHACAIEATHVHLLVGAVREDMARFIGRLKGTSSSGLLKHPANWGRSSVWTTGYWNVFLFEAEAMRGVARYIEAHNARRGLAASPYDWVQAIE